MKNITLTVLLSGVLGAGFLAGSWYTQRERVSASSLHARTVLYYVDPMHPAYTSDKPGVAPDCGMQLQPIYADGTPPVGADLKVGPHRGDETVRPYGAETFPPYTGAVNISAAKQQLIGVRVEPVENVSETHTLRLYGRVAPDETRVYRIDVGIDGFIRELSGATTGSRVGQHEWLATFSAPEARQPIQGYLVALDVLDRTQKGNEGRVTVELAGANVLQSIDRLLTLGMSRGQINEIARTRVVPPTVKITAPVDGFVLGRTVSEGQKVERGDELYVIADLRRVWILADVFGAETEYVRPGMVAEVSVPGFGRTVRATVSSAVLPQFDPVTQTLKVRLEADNPSFLLRPDMFVDVRLPVRLPPTIAVPADAVLDSGLKGTMFVERSPGLFEPREVETGWRFGDRVQILKGLERGERIVVSGTFLLDSETRMRHVTPESRRGDDRPHH